MIGFYWGFALNLNFIGFHSMEGCAVGRVLSDNIQSIWRLGILTYKQKTAFSEGQFDMSSTEAPFSSVSLWQKTVPLCFALFFPPRDHPYLCFSVSVFLPRAPLVTHFHCFEPDPCLETYGHWSIAHGEDLFFG